MPLIPVVCKSGVDILTLAGRPTIYYNLRTYVIGYINFLGRGGTEMRLKLGYEGNRHVVENYWY